MPKTLLFSFSSADCFKNFYALPGSLLEQLASPLSSGKIRVVFVIQEHRKGEIEGLLKYRDKTPNVFIESVFVKQRGNLSNFEKLFVFFYAYLVYTNTTKVLATMGMRLDEPPRGSGKIFAPLKWLLPRTFGKIPFIRNSFVPWLHERVFPERPFKNVFDAYKPDLVFTPNLHDRFDQEMSREAKRRGVRRLGMTLNWDHYDKYFLPFLPPRLLIQSEQMKDFAHRFQHYPLSQMTVVGYPFLDYIYGGKYTTSREETLKTLGFPQDAKYIMYIAGSMFCPDEPDVIEEMIRWEEEGVFGANVYFVIRPYPGGRGRDDVFDKQKFERFRAHPKVSVQMQKFWAGMETNMEFMNVMRHASAIMAIYSTAVLPAVALDRPLLTLGFDGYTKRPFHESVTRFAIREHFKDVVDSGGQVVAKDFSHLKAKLIEYLKNPHAEHAEREALRARILGPFDGKASERIFREIMSSL